MPILTIPHKFLKEGDLVVIPRREYERLRTLKRVREFISTPAEKRALARARKNFRSGKYVTLGQLRHELGFSRR